MEARARNLTGDGASLAFNDRDELVMINERAGVYWRDRASMPAGLQPRGWSGGRPPGS